MTDPPVGLNSQVDLCKVCVVALALLLGINGDEDRFYLLSSLNCHNRSCPPASHN